MLATLNETETTEQVTFVFRAGRVVPVLVSASSPDPQPDISHNPTSPTTRHLPQPKRDHDDMARRYRLQALTISNPDYRKYLLDQAEAAEAGSVADDGGMVLAHEVPAGIGGVLAGAGASGEFPQIGTEPTPKPAQHLTKSNEPDNPPIPENLLLETVRLRSYIKVPWRLSQAILAKNEDDLHQAYNLYLNIRGDYSGWHYQSDVIDMSMTVWGVTGRTVKRWLRAGEDLFWAKGWKHGRRTISYFNIKRVAKKFDTLPGQLKDVPTLHLYGDIQEFRAALYATWIKENGRWASRETIEVVTGVQPRTQFNYEKNLDIEVKKTFSFHKWTDPKTGKKYETLQRPNFYGGAFSNSHQHHEHKRRDLVTVGKNSLYEGCGTIFRAVNVSGQLLFDNANDAKEKAYLANHQGKMGQVFSVLKGQETPLGNMMLREYEVVLAEPFYGHKEQETRKPRSKGG